MEHKVIPTLAEKWRDICNHLTEDGWTVPQIICAEMAFYRGVRTYLEMQKEIRALGLSSPEMDRALHGWELEVYAQAVI
jgi:hypothetical protein